VSSENEAIITFYKTFQQHTGINYNTTITPKLAAMENEDTSSHGVHPDYAFICSAYEDLKEAISMIPMQNLK